MIKSKREKERLFETGKRRENKRELNTESVCKRKSECVIERV